MRRVASNLTAVAAALVLSPSAFPATLGPHPLQDRPAIDFALRSVDGPNVRLSEYRGEVVLVSFWGSRCGQCLPQLAALSRLQATYGSAGLVTLAVNVDDDQAAARQFLAARATGFPLLLDPAKGVARSWRVDSLPMVALVDRGGVVREVFRDYRSGAENDYQARIKALLDE